MTLITYILEPNDFSAETSAALAAAAAAAVEAMVRGELGNRDAFRNEQLALIEAADRAGGSAHSITVNGRAKDRNCTKYKITL